MGFIYFISYMIANNKRCIALFIAFTQCTVSFTAAKICIFVDSMHACKELLNVAVP